GVPLRLGQLFVVVGGGVVEEVLQPLRYLVGDRRGGRGWSLAATQGVEIDRHGVVERRRAGEQPLLQQQCDQVGGFASAGGGEALSAQLGELFQQVVHSPFAVRVADRDRGGLPGWEAGGAVRVDDVPFQAAHHGLLHRRGVGSYASGEPLVGEDLQQGGE